MTYFSQYGFTNGKMKINARMKVQREIIKVFKQANKQVVGDTYCFTLIEQDEEEKKEISFNGQFIGSYALVLANLYNWAKQPIPMNSKIVQKCCNFDLEGYDWKNDEKIKWETLQKNPFTVEMEYNELVWCGGERRIRKVKTVLEHGAYEQMEVPNFWVESCTDIPDSWANEIKYGMFFELADLVNYEVQSMKYYYESQTRYNVYYRTVGDTVHEIRKTFERKYGFKEGKLGMHLFDALVQVSFALKRETPELEKYFGMNIKKIYQQEFKKAGYDTAVNRMVFNLADDLSDNELIAERITSFGKREGN